MKEKILKALAKIRPALQADGGDVELVDVKPDGTVQVRLRGACAGCPMSQMTLKDGIERALKEAGFFSGQPDGIMGPQTREALRQFQQAKGLKADGMPGVKTLKALLDQRELQQPPSP